MYLEMFQKLLEEVPDYQEFMTVDELLNNTQSLVSRYPGSVELLKIGQSRGGIPIEVLKIGNGSKNALMIGMPHPMEPIGSLMLEHLSTHLAKNQVYREMLDYTWYIIKCIDPDGMKLNEGWFKGPFTLSHFVRNYYSPPHYQQVEWSFPINYKTLKFDRPIPETKLLMQLIKEIRPHFIYSLHNAAFGGCFLYVAKDTPALYPEFYKLVEDQGLPLHLGEAETPYIKKYAKAVFNIMSIKDSYDFLERTMEDDPAKMIRQGAGSYDYASQYCDPYFLVCELPYFYNSQIDDLTISDMSRRETVLRKMESAVKAISFVGEEYDQIKHELSYNSKFKDVIEYQLLNKRTQVISRKKWAETELRSEEKATIAESFDNLYVARIYQSFELGQFIRMVEKQIGTSGSTPILMASLERSINFFNNWMDDLEGGLDYEIIPLCKLVRTQLGAGLVLAKIAEERL